MSISHKRAGDVVGITMTILSVIGLGWLFLSDTALTWRLLYRAEWLYLIGAMLVVRFVLWFPTPRFLHPKPRLAPAALELSLAAQPVLDGAGRRDDSSRSDVGKQLIGE